MSDHKMQVIVKSYDKTELRTELSKEDGMQLVAHLKNKRKLSEQFHDFVHNDELSGTDDIISETNWKAAGSDIEAHEMLDNLVGSKYFYECMRLAENVIISLEKWPQEAWPPEEEGADE